MKYKYPTYGNDLVIYLQLVQLSRKFYLINYILLLSIGPTEDLFFFTFMFLLVGHVRKAKKNVDCC